MSRTAEIEKEMRDLMLARSVMQEAFSRERRQRIEAEARVKALETELGRLRKRG